MLEDLKEAFQYEVLKMLKKEGKINDALIENMLSCYHSVFNVYRGRTCLRVTFRLFFNSLKIKLFQWSLIRIMIQPQ